ncbi:MAG: hypothetical protein ACFFBP_04575 [Promethearchaeota archaeon]
MVTRHSNFTSIQPDAPLKKPKTNIVGEDTYFDNISNAIVSFLSLSKKIQRPDIYSATEDIPKKGVNPEFTRILKQEIDGINESLNEEKKKIELAEKKKFISPREFIKETAPKHWNVAHYQNSLLDWKKKLKSEYGLILDFDINIVYDNEKDQSFLNIDGAHYKLVPNLDKWKNSIRHYREDEDWIEINHKDYIELEGEYTIKELEMILLNALSKNLNSRYHDFLWLAYKTTEKFLMFKEESRNFYQIFIKEGELLTSMKL